MNLQDMSPSPSECILPRHYFHRIVAIYYVDGAVPADDAGLPE